MNKGLKTTPKMERYVSWLSTVIKAALTSAAGLLVLACAALPSVDARWKEEVRLNDGSTMIVRRSLSYDARTGPGGWRSLREHTLVFRPPGRDRDITWRSEYAEDTAQMELRPIAVDVVRGASYMVTRPNRCLAYNKWGRPNPPYVPFRFDGAAWQRIPLDAIPPEMGKTNLGQRTNERETAQWAAMDIVPWQRIERDNASIGIRELETILREPVQPGERISIVNDCPEMIPDGRGGWVGLDAFKSRSSLAECRRVCDLSRMTAAACPCDRFFERK